jgi:hypothetical protein
MLFIIKSMLFIFKPEEWSLYHNASLLINIRNWTLRESLRCLSKKLWLFIAIFQFENFDIWKLRFYNCFICDLNCTIFVLCGCRIMFHLC